MKQRILPVSALNAALSLAILALLLAGPPAARAQSDTLTAYLHATTLTATDFTDAAVAAGTHRNAIIHKIFTAASSVPDPAHMQASVSYFDALGRLTQEVAVKASPDGKDIISLFESEFLDHDGTKIFLPYKANDANYGSFRTGAEDDQQAWYDAIYGSGVRAWAGTLYETSGRNRVLASTLPGFSDETRTTVSKSGAEEVLHLALNPDGTAVSVVGWWPEGRFVRTTVSAPDGSVTTVFSNAFGSTVLEKRLVVDDTAACTYYIRDNRDRVLAVIPPAEYAKLSSSSASTLPLTHCYSYIYDDRDRIIAKKMPDGPLTSLTYNDADQVTLSVTGERRYATEYDPFNRPVAEKYGFGATPDRMLAQYAYDSYPADVEPFCPVEGIVASSDTDARTKGKKTFERIRVIRAAETESTMAPDADASYVTRTWYYDARGRVVQMVERNALGGLTRQSFRYDFPGNVLAERETVRPGASSGPGAVVDSITVSRSYSYDAQGRMTDAAAAFGALSAPATARVHYDFDDLGRPHVSTLGSGDAATSVTDSYTLQGWLAERSSSPFSMTLRYDAPAHESTEAGPGKTGTVTEWTFRQGNETPATYAFSYDKLSRLTDSRRYEGSSVSPGNAYTERNISYDLNGNVLRFTRYADAVSESSEPGLKKTYSYSGSRRTGDSYDPYGNVTVDGTTGTAYAWNILNLPRLTTSHGGIVSGYDYLADGTRVAIATGSKTVYSIGTMTFRKDAAEDAPQIESAAAPGGRLVAPGQFSGALYSITDHLGSVRAVVDGDGDVVVRNDYYPFGMLVRPQDEPITPVIDTSVVSIDPVIDPGDPVVPGPTGGNSVNGREDTDILPIHTRLDTLLVHEQLDKSVISLPRRFGGKEQLIFAGIASYDFGARLYSPTSLRWLAQDPLLEKYPGISPYAFCDNNPVNLIDPEGLNWYKYTGKDNAVQYEYYEGQLSEQEMKEHGFEEDLGYSFSENGTYYGLFGEIISDSEMINNISKAKIFKNIDNLLIRHFTDRDDENGLMNRTNLFIESTSPRSTMLPFSYYGKSFHSIQGEGRGSKNIGDATIYYLVKHENASCYISRLPLKEISLPSFTRSFSGYWLLASNGLGPYEGFSVLQIKFDRINAERFLSSINKLFGQNLRIDSK